MCVYLNEDVIKKNVIYSLKSKCKKEQNNCYFMYFNYIYKNKTNVETYTRFLCSSRKEVFNKKTYTTVR